MTLTILNYNFTWYIHMYSYCNMCILVLKVHIVATCICTVDKLNIEQCQTLNKMERVHLWYL